MTGIRLKKLLSRKGERSLIENLINELDINIQLTDKDGEFLIGETHTGTKYEIKHEGEVLGYVSGENGVSAVLNLIQYIISNELEKKQLSRETLDRYREVNLLHNLSKKTVLFARN